MSIDTPTDAELKEEAKAATLAERSDLSVSDDTLLGSLLIAFTDLVRGLYVSIASAENDIFPDSAMDTAMLERHATIALGPSPRKGATKSTGTDALTVTATAAGTVVSGDTLAHTDGTRFQLTEGNVFSGAGTADLSIESISTGLTANKTAAETLTFESAPANIQEEATLTLNCDGALDKETDPELLARLLFALANPGAGGRFSDYKAWAETVTGVKTAYTYGPSSVAATGRRGIGIVDTAVLTSGSGSNRIPSSVLVESVQDKINDERPDTTLDCLALEPDTDPEDIDIQIDPSAGYEFDYTEAAETVISWTLGSLEIELSAANATLQAAIAENGSARIWVGNNVHVVDLYSVGTGPGAAGDEIRLTATPSPVPTVGETIYAGGPLSAPARAAVVAYVDTLGPARGTSADPNQTWDDTLRVNKIAASLVHRTYADGTTSGVAGVKDVTIVTPAANVTPVDHAPSGTVDLIIVNDIIIRTV